MALVAAGAAALSLAACGSSKPATQTYTIHGILTMVGPTLPAYCRFDAPILGGYYAGLHEGAKIVVKDLNGKVLTTTSLSAGKPSRAECTWTFAARVPTAKFYAVTMPNHPEVVVSFSKLEKDHWKLYATPQ